jgi:hypothetical protein
LSFDFCGFIGVVTGNILVKSDNLFCGAHQNGTTCAAGMSGRVGVLVEEDGAFG